MDSRLSVTCQCERIEDIIRQLRLHPDHTTGWLQMLGCDRTPAQQPTPTTGHQQRIQLPMGDVNRLDYRPTSPDLAKASPQKRMSNQACTQTG